MKYHVSNKWSLFHFSILNQAPHSIGILRSGGYTVQKNLKLPFYSLAVFVLCYIAWQNQETLFSNKTIDKKNPYVRALLQHSSDNKSIHLCMVDELIADMGINFYRGSLLPHNVSNYLFLGTSTYACDHFIRHSIACFTYTEDPDGGSASGFFSETFKRKMNIRMKIILEALEAGFTVLHGDSDIHFFQNPFPFLHVGLFRRFFVF